MHGRQGSTSPSLVRPSKLCERNHPCQADTDSRAVEPNTPRATVLSKLILTFTAHLLTDAAIAAGQLAKGRYIAICVQACYLQALLRECRRKPCRAACKGNAHELSQVESADQSPTTG
jgi:hypothetical protein